MRCGTLRKPSFLRYNEENGDCFAIDEQRRAIAATGAERPTQFYLDREPEQALQEPWPLRHGGGLQGAYYSAGVILCIKGYKAIEIWNPSVLLESGE